MSKQTKDSQQVLEVATARPSRPPLAKGSVPTLPPRVAGDASIQADVVTAHLAEVELASEVSEIPELPELPDLPDLNEQLLQDVKALRSLADTYLIEEGRVLLRSTIPSE